MGFWQIIGAGWRGAFGAVKTNVGLFLAALLVAVAVSCALNLIVQHFIPFGGLASKFGVQGNPINPQAMFAMMRPFLLVSTLGNFIQTIVIASAVTPCMIAVHRFILCAESHVAFTSLNRLRHFAALLLLIQIIDSGMGTAPLVFLGTFGVLVQSVFSLGAFIFALASVRLLLAFPAIALDIPNPLQDSWARTRTHWWYIVGIFFVGTMTLVLAMIPLMILSALLPLFVQKPGLYGGVLNGLFLVAVPVLGAGFASELYRKYGGVFEPAV